MTKAFVTHAKIQCEGPCELVVVLCKTRCLPDSEFAICDAKVIERSKDIAEFSMVASRTQSEQKVRPTQKLQKRTEALEVHIVLKSGERAA